MTTTAVAAAPAWTSRSANDASARRVIEPTTANASGRPRDTAEMSLPTKMTSTNPTTRPIGYQGIGRSCCAISLASPVSFIKERRFSRHLERLAPAQDSAEEESAVGETLDRRHAAAAACLPLVGIAAIRFQSDRMREDTGGFPLVTNLTVAKRQEKPVPSVD